MAPQPELFFGDRLDDFNLRELDPILKEYTDQLVDRHHPGPGVDGVRDGFRARITAHFADILPKALEAGRLLVLKEEGRTIGLVEAEKLNPTPAFQAQFGREVYEVGTAVITQSRRGQGHYSRMRQTLVDRLAAQHPDARLVTFTENVAVQHLCRRMGWLVLSVSDYFEARGLSAEDAHHVASQIGSEYRCYISPPSP